MTLNLIQSGVEIWRKHVTDAVPSSGLHSPDQNEIQSWAGDVESLLDVGFGISVITRSLSTPPVSPATGARYIVGSSPDGDWSTYLQHDIAEWDGVLWSNRTPSIGNAIYIVDEAARLTFTGSNWTSEFPKASASDQETASSNGVAVTPGVQHRHPSAAKVWAYFGVTGNNIVSFNVSSIGDNGPGDATVNFTTHFSSANYCSLVGTESSGIFTHGQSFAGAEKATDHCRVLAVTFSAGAAASGDPNAYNFVAFGDQ
jgi:hypothetical protein